MTVFGFQIAQAQAAIKANGQVVTWRKTTRTPDNNQPWKAAVGAPQDSPVSMLFLKGGFTNPLVSMLRNTDVTEGAPDAIMAGGLSFVPEKTDVVIKDGQALAVESVDPLAPDGTAILFYIRFK